MSETGDLLRAAAERLRGRWLQGNTTNAAGDVCAVEACTQQGLWFRDAVRHLDPVVQEQYPERVAAEYPGRIVDFNDHPDTVEADVLAVFEKAAARADEQVTP